MFVLSNRRQKFKLLFVLLAQYRSTTACCFDIYELNRYTPRFFRAVCGADIKEVVPQYCASSRL